MNGGAVYWLITVLRFISLNAMACHRNPTTPLFRCVNLLDLFRGWIFMPPSIFALLPSDCIALIMHSYKIGLRHRMVQVELNHFFRRVYLYGDQRVSIRVSIMSRLNPCLMQDLCLIHRVQQKYSAWQLNLWHDYRSLIFRCGSNELRKIWARERSTINGLMTSTRKRPRWSALCWRTDSDEESIYQRWAVALLHICEYARIYDKHNGSWSDYVVPNQLPREDDTIESVQQNRQIKEMQALYPDFNDRKPQSRSFFGSDSMLVRGSPPPVTIWMNCTNCRSSNASACPEQTKPISNRRHKSAPSS